MLLLGAVEVVAPVRAKSYLHIGQGCGVSYNPKTVLEVIAKAARKTRVKRVVFFFNFFVSNSFYTLVMSASVFMTFVTVSDSSSK
jgi:hypothetical protein